MKLAIFGATGGVGRFVVKQSLAKGHEITALVRAPQKLRIIANGTTAIRGDVLDQTAVNATIKNCDVVLCLLGRPLLNNEGLRAKGTQKIIHGMAENGVKRLVCLSAFGTGESRAALPSLYKYILGPTLMRRMFNDHGAQEKLIRETNLDWTIARPAAFSDGPQTGAYSHGFTTYQKGLKIKISRADVAEFIVSQIDSDTYLHCAANLSD